MTTTMANLNNESETSSTSASATNEQPAMTNSVPSTTSTTTVGSKRSREGDNDDGDDDEENQKEVVNNENEKTKTIVETEAKTTPTSVDYDEFIQDKPCLNLVGANRTLTLCRDCEDREENDDEAGEVETNKLESDTTCRFVGWRRLKATTTAATSVEFEVVGFLGPQDAQQDDVDLWSVPTISAPKCEEVDLDDDEEDDNVYKKILLHIKESFNTMIVDEIQIRDAYMREPILWKRQMHQTREMCDQCRTTLFNGHFACLKCGFAVCLDCFNMKKKEKNSKFEFKTEITNWYYCSNPKSSSPKKKTKYEQLEHQPENLTYVQYILPKVYAEFKKHTSDLLFSSPVKSSSVSHLVSHPGDDFNEYMCLDLAANKSSEKGDEVSRDDDEASLRASFEKQWNDSRRRPVVIRNVHTRLAAHARWSPHAFAADFGDLCVDLIDCRTHRVVAPPVKLRSFWDGFEDETRRLRDERTARPMILKLKDWPTSDDFKHLMPDRFDDLMQHMPLRDYTSRDGVLNLASYLPSSFCLPDLGPKLYVAYSSADMPKGGTTNLHVDISDAVNLLIYAAPLSDDVIETYRQDGVSTGGSENGGTSSETEQHNNSKKSSDQTPKKKTSTSIRRHLLSIIQKSGCPDDQVQRFRNGEIPGALWHIFKPHDANEIRTYLVKQALVRAKLVRPNSDSIHDQVTYVNDQMLRDLYAEHQVRPHTIVQFLGDAVFIPAGAPHQVRNLNSCIKVALDFVSPQGVSQCLLITDQLRMLSEKHVNREDKLQARMSSDETVSEENASILNLQLINKNDKKLIKLTTTSASATATTSSFDTLKSKIIEIMSLEGGTEKPTNIPVLPPMTTTIKLSHIGSDVSDDDKEHSKHTTSTRGKRRLQHQQKEQQCQTLICSECGLEFRQLSELNKHMWNEHGTRSSGNDDHISGTSNNDGSQKYKCSMCEREFLALSSKSRHEREHAGLKPYPCHICAFDFTRASNLRTHLLRTHANDAGVLYRLSKSDDNGNIQIEFDFEAIRQRKEQQKFCLTNQMSSSEQLRTQQAPQNNTIIYIRDPKNKNGNIQHMVVYINGKPIFVQNPNLSQEDKLDIPSTSPKRIKIPYQLTEQCFKETTTVDEIKLSAKLPASKPQKLSNNWQQHQNSMTIVDDNQDYMQLVSLFRQKNEKLFNPLNS